MLQRKRYKLAQTVKYMPIYKNLDAVQDDRTFAKKTERYVSGKKVVLLRTVKTKKPKYRYKYQVNQTRYANPLKAITCIRRKVRRQTLFALKLTGKGSGSPKRFTEKSFIKC